MISFSVIVTSHNQAKFICGAVQSALSQTYTRKEIIVVDDASCDESPEVLKRFGNGIRLITLKENVGASRARNVGVTAATGEFLVFLDGDDVLLPWALNAYSQIAEQKNPEIILSRMLWFETQAPQLEATQAPKNVEVVAYESLLEKDRPYRASASALVIRRNTFNEVQGWTNELFPMEDLDVLVKLLHSGRTVQILAPPTVGYRVHSANTIHQVANCASALRTILRKEKRGGYPNGTIKKRQRYAFLGGPALFWIKRAYKGKLYGEVLRILASGWPMIFAAGMRGVAVSLRRRRPVQILTLDLQT
jgi:teichuronic acid biosynthesis glycosyltransferase TuaG